MTSSSRKRRRRRTRLQILAACVVGVGVLVGGAYVLRQVQLDSAADAARERGFEALAKGEHRIALDGIGRFLQRHGERPGLSEEWHQYGVLLTAPESGKRDVKASIAALRRALTIDGARLDTRRALLPLYVETGMFVEAVSVTDALLQRKPDDVETLLFRRDLLEGLNRKDEALETCETLNRLLPEDMDALFRTLALRSRMGHAGPDLVEWAEGLRAERPDDPRLVLLECATRQVSGDSAAAAVCLDEAMRSGPFDIVSAQLLARLLDRAGRPEDALTVLEEAETIEPSAVIRRERAMRLWFAGRRAELERLLADPGEDGHDLLALRGLLAAEGGDSAKALEIAAELDADGASNADLAWAALLRAHAEDQGPAAMRDACRAAGELDPRNAVIRNTLADALHETGDSDSALVEWQRAHGLAPAWATPMANAARTLAQNGHPALALEAAERARRAAPRDRRSVSTWAFLLAGQRKRIAGAEGDEILAFLAEACDTWPGDGRLVASRLVLLARKERGAASAAAAALTDAEPAPSADVLCWIAGSAPAITDDHEELTERALARCASVHGSAPETTVARAAALVRAGRSDDALRLLGDSADEPSGIVAIEEARLLDELGDPAATAVWHDLAQARGEDLRVHLALIASDAPWRDRARMPAVLDRLEEMVGEQGAAWRRARARWVIEDTAAGPEDLRASVAQLTEVVAAAPGAVTARAMLAALYERLGDATAAEEQLEGALAAASDPRPVYLDLARMAHARGEHELAGDRLRRSLMGPPPQGVDLLKTVRLLVLRGQLQRAAQVLDSATEGREPTARERIVRATIAVDLRDLDGADRQLEPLLAEGPATAWAVGAQVAALRGARERAEQLLTRYASAEQGPGRVDQLRGRIELGLGDPQAARAAFRRATEAAPSLESAWRSLVRVDVQTGDAAAAAVALQSAPAGLGALASRAGSVRAGTLDPRLRPLVLAMLDSPRDAERLGEALDAALSAGAEDGALPTDRLERLLEIADGLRNQVSVQVVAGEELARAGRMDEACDLASRAMAGHPKSVAPARLAAHLFAARGDWPGGLRAARDWRDRPGGARSDADMCIARALLELHRPGEAADTLARYRDVALERPADFEPLLAAYVHGLVGAARIDEAIDMAGRLEGDGWMLHWLRISGAAPPAAAARWLQAVAPTGVADRGLEIQLAYRWQRIALATKDPAHRRRFTEIASRVTQRKDASAREHLAVGMLRDALGDLEGAGSAYRRALELDPELHDARNNLAVIMSASGQVDEAIAMAERISEAMPARAVYRDTLAGALLQAGETERAIAAERKALELDPANGGYALRLAEILVDTGDDDGARRTLASVPVESLDALDETSRRRVAALRVRLDQE